MIKERLKKDIKTMDSIKYEYYKNKKKVISFSMLSTIDTCYRQYKFQYVDRAEGKKDNVYSYLGTLAHKLIEELYRDEIDNFIAKEEWLKGLESTEHLFLDYTRAENPEIRQEMFEKNELYKNNYNTNMKHYFDNFKKIDYVDFLQEEKVNFELKSFFNAPLFDNFLFNGIIDFIGINKDGSLDILDYKTSTMYKGEKLELHSYQLIFYAMALEKLGYKINRIGWNFLKYATKIKQFKNGNIRYTNVERKELIKLDDDSIDFKDCIVEIDYTVENKRKALKFIYDNVFKIIKLDNIKDINTNKIPYNYEKFFCENLCSFYSICSVGI